MKRILTAVFAVCLCFSTVFALASCGCEKEEDTRVIIAKETQPDVLDDQGYGYIIVDGKTLTITQYKGSAMELDIPSEYDGKPVTAIGDHVFRSQAITSVKIPSSIESIGNRAFSDCASLTNISFSEGLKVIDNFAFSYCSGLKEVKFPSTLTSINQYAFTGCGLVSIDVPDSVTEIGHMAFYQCADLESAKIPSTVKEFGQYVFDEDKKLTITCPKGSEAEKYAKKYDIKYKTA